MSEGGRLRETPSVPLFRGGEGMSGLFLFAFAKKSTKNLSKIIAHRMREGKFRLIPRGNTKDVRCEMDDV